MLDFLQKKTSPIQVTTTATSSSSAPTTESSAEPQWNTPPDMLPSQWIQHQLDFRARALDQMLDGSHRDTAPFLAAFHNIRQRPPRLDDLPHWQQLDLAPNPAHTDFHSVYLPVLLNVTLRMAQLNHPPVIANPLWSAQLAQLETHMGHWTTLRSQLQHPALDQDDHTFRSQFQQVHNRTPQQDDVPTWHHIILTEDIVTHRPLTWAEYQTAARQHMLHPLASATGTDSQMTNLRESTSSPPPPIHTPSSSPPRQVAPGATTEQEQAHRTSVTTSPCLTDKRRSRSSDDRSIAQQQHKEQQIATKRLTRRSQPAPTPDPTACCNRFCTLLTPPTLSDGGICRATQRIMHSACRSPCRLSETAGYCRSCSPATETPAP